jgi:hypothetical protein
MDAGEGALVADTVRDAVTALGDDRAPAGVDAVLEDLGWLDLLEAEPDDAIAIVARTLGAANGHATVLDDVVVRALGVEARGPRPELAVLLPAYGSWDRPNGHGLTTARLTTADELLVVTDDGALVVPVARVRATPVRGIDPSAGWQRVDVDTAEGDRVPLAPDAWGDAVAWARRTLAYDVLGATRTMLDLAREHARDRVQFDRPIARFQAVRHRLAEALVAIEALDAALGAARDEPSQQTAALAKAIAGRTARTVAAHCQQVLAGIGFTTEHAYHRFLKRTVLLDGLFGSSDGIVRDVGRTLLATGRVPTLIEL